MKRINNKKNLYKSIILLVIVIIGIGYAYLTSNLSITGATEVVANTWDIHFENLNVIDGSVTATTPAEIDSNETSIEYAITLSRPKDYYEFTVDVVNEGTLPGKVSISELSGLDATSSKVIDYLIKYTYGQSVNVGDILNGGATKTIKVRVYYKDDIDEDDFPDNNLNLNLTYTLQFLQSDKDEVTTDSIIQSLKTNNSSCFTKYVGSVTDRVGLTETATNVYYDNCEGKRNVIFGGFCWQMIRTTETGGVKMIYNGEPVDGKCESTRENHIGLKGNSGTTVNLSSNYLYGNSFTYDVDSNKFTLVDTFEGTWSDSTYESLLGKFTCKNSTGICDTIYNVNGYYTNQEAFTESYTLSEINHTIVGMGAYNAYDYSPAMVGYMFNKSYKYNQRNITEEYKYGNSFTYDENTNKYTLSGTTQNIEDWSTGYNTIDNTHYTCWNTSGVCETISYIYNTGTSYAYYMKLENGKNINDLLNEMLYAEDVNKYNSTIKGTIDAWYAKNLNDKTSMIEDTVYCNNRTITSLGGWDPNSGSTITNSDLNFYSSSTTLACQNITDQFAVGNNKAKLTYPIGFLQNEEKISASHFKSVVSEWLITPSYYSAYWAYVRYLSGLYTYSQYVGGSVHTIPGYRPVISLASFVPISSGTGSETDPWVID